MVSRLASARITPLRRGTQPIRNPDALRVPNSSPERLDTTQNSREGVYTLHLVVVNGTFTKYWIVDFKHDLNHPTLRGLSVATFSRGHFSVSRAAQVIHGEPTGRGVDEKNATDAGKTSGAQGEGRYRYRSCVLQDCLRSYATRPPRNCSLL